MRPTKSPMGWPEAFVKTAGILAGGGIFFVLARTPGFMASVASIVEGIVLVVVIFIIFAY